ncbi:60S ribosomal protein L14 [Schizosaccharomyces cryophilus OY26]|uniref:60S ribosomal protein L14 n=1 Tax=Schizosaccharomyces cryophilus (strain OY26 / ATCC MYA-4695 / CBS 11777 / NBRC 106824 / NRRL Y48691) TaxID=653667 RepID=S9W2K5_SCHCR|nr:60S ribosomal protein L14 [Schizosaccharomyces cryophilus OY26]EPY52674.1 60S ribosomal protein L14 [Schizosaccharomyces cryophilus OY26]
MNGFQRYVQVGRIILLKAGPQKGKLAAIVDIIDHKRVIVDSICQEFPRQIVRLSQVTLTSIVMSIPRGATSGIVAKKWQAQNISQKWAATAWAKKLEALKTRSQLGDFERFAVVRYKKQRRNQVQLAVASA